MTILGITKTQIRILHSLVHALGIPDPDYRSILHGYGVRSSKNLNYRQAKDIISKLEPTAISMGVWKQNRRMEPAPRRPGMATPKQLAKIRAMWWKVSRMPTPKEREAALNIFIQRITGVRSIEWLERPKVQTVIAALDAMIAKMNQPLQAVANG